MKQTQNTTNYVVAEYDKLLVAEYDKLLVAEYDKR